MTSDQDLGWEYVPHRPDAFGETTFETRHKAIGHAAVLGRYTDDEFEVFARKKTREPMVNDALWRAQILNEDLEHVGWTLLYEARSFAADAAYRHILMNHLEMVRVSTKPWYGEDYRQVGALESGSDDQYPIYVGFDEDGDALEHDVNQLQYAEHITNASLSRVDRSENKSPEEAKHVES